LLQKIDLLSLIPADELFPLVEELLRDGRDVVISARGNSMYPLIRSDKDTVKLTAANYNDVKKGAITLVRRDSGAYVIHRVCKITPVLFYMVGDHQQEIEGPLRPDQLIAMVTEVHRGKHTIRRGSLLWVVFARIWLFLRPIRRQVLAMLIALRSLVKRFMYRR